LIHMVNDLFSGSEHSRSPLSTSAHFADACAYLWIAGELVHLEDLVLHDAGHDVLERAGHINSAGRYLRDLRSKARRGEVFPWVGADGANAGERDNRP